MNYGLPYNDIPEKMKNITRKEFISICGSILAGGSIAAVSAILLRRTYLEKDGAKNNCQDCSGCKVDCPIKNKQTK